MGARLPTAVRDWNVRVIASDFRRVGSAITRNQVVVRDIQGEDGLNFDFYIPGAQDHANQPLFPSDFVPAEGTRLELAMHREQILRDILQLVVAEGRAQDLPRIRGAAATGLRRADILFAGAPRIRPTPRMEAANGLLHEIAAQAAAHPHDTVRALLERMLAEAEAARVRAMQAFDGARAAEREER